MSERHGKIQKKVLLLLFSGLALGLSNSPKTSFKILKDITEEWHNINRRALTSAIKSLYESKMINMKYHKEKDAVTIILTDQGKEKALTYDLDKLEIKKPKQWDKKWRIVLFDIPENIKKARESLRYHLKKLNFYEFQKSVFVHPYDCKNEIDYIIELYGIRECVRFVVADSLDNELHLKDYFELL